MDDTGFRVALVRRDLPALCGGRHEQAPSPRAQLAVLLKRCGDRSRPADHLNASDWISVDVGCRREFCDYLRPVRVHLIGEEHGQLRMDALAELEPVDLDDDLAVRSNVDEGIRWINLGVLCAHWLRTQRTIEVQRNEQAARGCRGGYDERATRNLLLRESH